MAHYNKVSILIPAYNEENTIEKLLQRVKEAPALGLEKEIVVADDCSSDGTRKILKAIPGISYIFHDRNQGKGAALKTAMHHASGDIFLIQDADMEYDPFDYPVLLQPIIDGQTDFVMGSRFHHEMPRFFIKNSPPFFSHFIGNIVIVTLTNFLFGQKNTDYEACYKAFTRSVAQAFKIETNGFAFDNELICKTLRKGYRILEVPVRYRPRLYQDGKKIGWRDGLVMCWNIIKWRFKKF
ncbi:MAG: hypothetical protein A3C35_07165 [Omnitrophica bacterium RIFCSPHIGHO2_02_FULL_46_11]|nr:MAG: hypothetical protein A3A81_00765 [Omnitrophica bacterium RIFCSPLOWO2_01_FULL_45_10b]OGW85988.1 MAG: hypothetical protein A3C35_07165 [Omnitrophica bacterium RIFCSPHIGHO2_02_FULL_46_11]